MPSRLRFVIRMGMLCLLVLSIAGCHRAEPPPPAVFTMDDHSHLFTTTQKKQIEKRAEALFTQFGVHIMIITVPDLTTTEMSGFADRLFDAAPYCEELLGYPDNAIPQAKEVREAWAGRGILICTSQRPQVVFVRMGGELQNAIDDMTLHRLLEDNAYRRVMHNQLSSATLATFTKIEERLQHNPDKITHFNTLQMSGFSALHTLRRLEFPIWRIFYPTLIDPLLNSMVLVMRATGYSVWSVLLWIFLLHLTVKLLWRSILAGIARSMIGRALRKQYPGYNAAQLKQHIRVVMRDPKSKMTENAIADFCANLTRLVLGVPVWACLSLITLPLWENILTMRQHLYPGVQVDLASHRLFVLQQGLLWWDRPAAPAGIAFALVFAIFYWTAKIPDCILATTRDAATGDGDYERYKWLWGRLIFIPIAFSYLPFCLGLYFFVATVLEALQIKGKIQDIRTQAAAL